MLRCVWSGPARADCWYRKVDPRERAHVEGLKARGEQWRPLSYDGTMPHQVEFTDGQFKPHVVYEREYLVVAGGALLVIEKKDAQDMGEEGTGIRPITPYNVHEPDVNAAAAEGGRMWGALNKGGIPASVVTIFPFPEDLQPYDGYIDPARILHMSDGDLVDPF